ncbi:hypothetical protein PBY51_012645 [Eleginops maclovinus]|uniref:Uncharacterized protein n=1 Tax=Eleginops maclovinus TaxID=56733 RepID=A0AAN7Y3E9_ELEMC|nr:hypothetical protein PBY51_012645 [Eleginops maclovinus]
MTRELEAAESQRAAMRLALVTTTRSAMDTLSQRLNNIERGTPPAHKEHLDTSPYQPRRRLFGFQVDQGDPQPLQPAVLR